MYQLYIYSLDSKAIQPISNGLFHDFNPVFTKDGEHLIFISDRQFDPTYCDLEWEMVYKKIAGIYSITLKKDGKSLFPFKQDEENSPETTKSSSATPLVSIDFDGITDRVEPFPLARGNYRNLSVNESALFYQNASDGDFNRFEFRVVNKLSLYAFSFNDGKERQIATDVNQYQLSADGKQLIYRIDNQVSMVASDSKSTEAQSIDLSDLKMQYNPKEEWKQIFNEAWRMERDYYYEPGMHGLDWNQMRTKYGKLVDRASCRQDLTFIIGELIGELNTSHTYVYGGDTKREADQVNVGLLGVDWKIDGQNNRYQFNKDSERVIGPAKFFLHLPNPELMLKMENTC